MARLTVNEAGTSGYTHVISLSFDDLAKIKLGTDPFNGETLDTAGQLPIATIPGGGAAATNLIYKFGGTVANLTAGEVIIGVRVFDPMRFSAS